MDLVLVTWEDAASWSRWHPRSDMDNDSLNPVMCKSVGWVLKRNKRRVVLVPNINDHEYGDITVIPMSAVRAITVLVEGG